MKKRHILSAWILPILFLLAGCYEDEGNYEYHEINELEVDSIADGYNIDVYDSLIIKPVLKGSLYSDTSRFTYSWEIGGSEAGKSHDLAIEMKLQPGRKYSRYIVTDKNTGVKKYHSFYVNVSSSTAGDLILVLSKYRGKAELSYLRLDKPAEWQVNSFEAHNGEALGTDPRQLSISYLESGGSFPFANGDGRIMVVTDDKIKLLYKNSLLLDTLSPVLQKDAYLKLAVYPKPDIKEYRPQFVSNQIAMWRYYGTTPQIWVYHMMISAGRLYTTFQSNGNWSPNYTFDEKSPYENGSLAPFGYWDDMSDTPNGGLLQAGYEPGDFILFDAVKHRFALSGSYGGVHEIKETDVKAFPGYSLLWGTATNMENHTSLAVLNQGDRCRFVLLENGKDEEGQETKKLAGETDCGNIPDARSKFYMMKYNEYLLFSAGSKVYRYHIGNIGSSAPSEGDKVIDLRDYGYGSDAVITDICVSRSEKTLLVGVSRYGADSGADGAEPKGDLLYFNLEKTTVGLTYVEKKSRKGIAGIPVDVEIKYQTHYRNGEDVTQGGKYMDKI